MADADGNIFGPFDVSVPDSEAEPFTEEAYFRMHDESGVVEGFGLTFAGLTAQLAPGFAYSHGGWLVRDEQWLDAAPPTTGVDPRRDLLVLRRTLTIGEGDDAIPGRVVPVVLRGAPAPAPVNAAHDPDTDTRLWSWRVPGSGGTVVTVITDHREFVNRDGSPSVGASVPMGEITGTATVPIAPGAYRKVTGLNTLIRARGITHVNGELEVDEAGVYLVSGCATYAVGSVVNKRHLSAIGHNGAANLRTQGRADPSVGDTTPIPTTTYQLNLEVGDRISLLTRQDTGASQDIDRAASFLQAVWIGTPD